MIKHNQDGAVSSLAISLVFCILVLIGAIGFGAWAYSSRQDYKNNSDQKATVAAETARQQESTVKDQQFAQESKNPLKAYNGPDSTGSLHIEFPKTWSGYVVDSGQNSNTLDGYFTPGVVPSADDQSSVFALRVQVEDQAYAQEVKSLSNQQQQGDISVSAYSLPRLPKIVGVKVVGQLTEGHNVNMVMLPLRSETLKIWTDGSQYVSDYNDIILKNFTFAP
jgi:hypothetical protein